MDTGVVKTLLSRALAILGVLALCALVACGRQPSGPGTQTNDPVIITTDHSVYGPGNTIHVTVTNHLAIPIRTEPEPRSCILSGMEFRKNSDWHITVACSLAGAGYENRGGVTQEIKPGSTVISEVVLGADAPSSTYRLIFTYLPLPTVSPPPGTRTPDWTTVYSATFQVKS